MKKSSKHRARCFVLGASLLASACGASQTEVREPVVAGAVESVYQCKHGPLVLMGGRAGRVLVDEGRGRVLLNRWGTHDGDHFLTFGRVGVDRRPVAFEYLVPADRALRATVYTYDKALGAQFKITARGTTWRIRGEPSSRSSCAAVRTAVALR